MAQHYPRSDWYRASFRASDGGALRRDRNAPQSPDSGFAPAPPAADGVPDAPGAPEDYPDYRDFFRSYYGSAQSAVPESEGSHLPRLDATGDSFPELVSAEGLPELSLQELYSRCADTVVGIRAVKNSFSYAWGSGFIVRADGYIVTNQHIIDGCRSAEVILTDGRSLQARLVGEDSFTDIAVLKIAAENLPCVQLGESEELTVGDPVAAIGNPIGAELSGTMTDGIISAINREVSDSGRHLTLLQTNAAINEGNSGGPLFNRYGQVVGITNMKMVNFSSAVIYEGIGFAIPSATLKAVADQLMESGAAAAHPGLGLTLGAVPEEAQAAYALPEGLYVSDIAPKSDAATKDIQVGDVVTAVNGTSVRSTDDVVRIRDGFSVGDEMTLTVYREGRTFEVTIRLMDITELY